MTFCLKERRRIGKLIIKRWGEKRCPVIAPGMELKLRHV